MAHLTCDEALKLATTAIAHARPPNLPDGRDSLRYEVASREALAYAMLAIAAAIHPPDHGSLHDDLDALRDGLRTIRAELHEIRETLTGPPAPRSR